jgi:hypothetical protein
VCSFIRFDEGERKRVDFVTRIFRRKKKRKTEKTEKARKPKKLFSPSFWREKRQKKLIPKNTIIEALGCQRKKLSQKLAFPFLESKSSCCYS